MENLSNDQTGVQLLDFNLYDLDSYKNAKALQEELVTNNPYIEVADKVSYEEGKKRRTALLKGRTSLQEGEKAINRRLTDIKRFVSNETEKLINITQPHEEKQQIEVKRYETELEEEKNRIIRIENERKQKIRDAIDNFRKKALNAIREATYVNIDNLINDIQCYEMECGEFSEELDFAKNELALTYEPKKKYLYQDEELRVVRAKAELTKTRGRLLLNYGYICNDDLSEMDEESFFALLQKRKDIYLLAEEEKEAERKKLEQARNELDRREREEQARINAENEIIAKQAREVEQVRIKAENEAKAEQARIEAENEAKAEKDRIERQRPDQEKIIRAIQSIEFPQLDLTDNAMKEYYHNISIALSNWKQQLINNLK